MGGALGWITHVLDMASLCFNQWYTSQTRPATLYEGSQWDTTDQRRNVRRHIRAPYLVSIGHVTSQLLPSRIKVTNNLAVWGLDWWCLQCSGMQSYRLAIYSGARAWSRGSKEEEEIIARVRSSEEFFCTVRSLLASFDRTIFSLACGLLQPRSQAPPSFPSLAVRFSVLQAMESWAGPGNEAFAWRCQLAPLLGGHPRKATKHNFVPTTTDRSVYIMSL